MHVARSGRCACSGRFCCIACSAVSHPYTNADWSLSQARPRHRHLGHENIIAVKDIMVPPARDKFNDVYIVYELMDTDLHQIIRSPQPLTNEHFQYFVYQVSCGTSCGQAILCILQSTSDRALAMHQLAS